MLIEFINSHENWQELLSGSPYNIKIKQDEDYFLLKYDQLNSLRGDELVNECRGCIVYYDQSEQKWIYVCRPFVRFFNYGEGCAAKIDWTSARVLEKVDGSLIKVWYHNGWHVSTSGTIDAEKSECGDFNYFDLFLKASNLTKELWNYSYANCDTFHEWSWLNPKKTYLFELVSPWNKLVVPYENTELYYLGEIDNTTGQEVYRFDGKFCSKEVEDFFGISNIKDAVAAANKISADDGEGFVVVDKNFNRIKIKGEDYLRHFYYRNNGIITTRRVILAMQESWIDDLWAYNPEAHQMIVAVMSQVMMVGAMFNSAFKALKERGWADQKEYAEFVKSYPKDCWAYLFYAKKTTKPLGGMDWLLQNKNPAQIEAIINNLKEFL